MTLFDEREKSFENKHAHDAEVAFRIHSKQRYLLAKWAAVKLALEQAQAEEYARALVERFVEEGDDAALAAAVAEDFAAAGVQISEKSIRQELERLQPAARKTIQDA